jgi:hypothetical protein
MQPFTPLLLATNLHVNLKSGLPVTHFIRLKPEFGISLNRRKCGYKKSPGPVQKTPLTAIGFWMNVHPGFTSSQVLTSIHNTSITPTLSPIMIYQPKERHSTCTSAAGRSTPSTPFKTSPSRSPRTPSWYMFKKRLKIYYLFGMRPGGSLFPSLPAPVRDQVTGHWAEPHKMRVSDAAPACEGRLKEKGINVEGQLGLDPTRTP